jgi:xylulokinase
VFAESFATVAGARLELYRTDGAQGAARGAGIGAGIYPYTQAAFASLEVVRSVEPTAGLTQAYQEAYRRWAGLLEMELARRAHA